MSRVLRVYVDDVTERALANFSQLTGRTVEELAEAAVSEAALQSARASGLPPLTGQLQFKDGAFNRRVK